MPRRKANEPAATWNDPSLEETISKLEWCYQHREQLEPLACQAALDMKTFSWQRLAKGLLNVVGLSPAGEAQPNSSDLNGSGQ